MSNKLTFDQYQQQAAQFAIYPKIKVEQENGEWSEPVGFVYPLMGLNGECGETSEKLKKILRDKKGNISHEDKQEISKELGDIMWYIANLARELDLSLGEIAEKNIEKLQSRKDRGKLSGSGDNR